MGESSTDQNSFTEKGVIPPPPGDEFHKKNDPFTSICSGRLPAIGTIAFDPDVAIAVEIIKPYVVWCTVPNYIYPMWVDFKSSEEDEPVAPKIAKSDCFKFCDFAPSHKLLARGSEEEIQKLGMYTGFQVLEHGWPSVQAPKDPNGSSASEGGAPVMTGKGLDEYGNPLLMKWIDHLIINIPVHAEEDSPGCKFLKGERGQKVRGKVAMLCAGVSAQTILGLAGGPGAMNLPKPIFYSAAAANAIAFGGSALALLLIKKKPYAASILERVGFASAIATFLLMMSAFMP